MKKITLLMVVLLAGVVIAAGCKKAPKAEGEVVIEEETVEVKGAVPDQFCKDLSAALCKRMVECAPGTMTEEECTAQTAQALAEAIAQKPIEVSTADKETCIGNIAKGSCEEVMGTEPPKGCEFLK